METAIRVMRERGADVMVMSGGAVRSDVSEAEAMVKLALQLGIDPERLRAETRSRSTWENVGESAAFVTDCEVVIIVSDPMHAARARRYWCKQYPEDAEHVFSATDRRPLERWWLLAPAACYEALIAVRDRIRFGLS